jgi:23S rRNA G2069 N7-methylase RlmK/C1962 C5-methylase RlmI
MVVIDPPAFASAAARGGKPWSAINDYSELIGASLEVLVPGGLLVAGSSTHKMTAQDFELALADGALMKGTRLQIIDRRAPPDFQWLGFRGQLPQVHRRGARLVSDVSGTSGAASFGGLSGTGNSVSIS